MSGVEFQQLMVEVMGYIAQKGWANFTIDGLSEYYGYDSSEIYGYFGHRQDVLLAVSRFADCAVQRYHIQPDQPVRDKIFELVMSRFDGLQPLKDGLLSITHSLPREPVSGVILTLCLPNSLLLLLKKAGLATSGMKGIKNLACLSYVYLTSFRQWLKDEQPDMGLTMAALDRLIRKQHWLE
ncbi:MAG: hypothetical protein ACOYK8_05045 [Alphaproteobacteria bacterium]